VLQQAQPARAARLQKDRHALQQAVQQAIQLMHQAVLQLQQQSFPNIFVAGKAAEVGGCVAQCSPQLFQKLCTHGADLRVTFMALPVDPLLPPAAPLSPLFSFHPQEACTSAHTHFVHLAAQQHSCAPDCPEYQTQLLAVEAAVDQGREQLMAALQAAAAATAVPGG
jgi:hypothetical protein